MTYCHSIIQILNTIFVRLSRWAWGKRHDGEQHICFLLGSTPLDWEGRSDAHFPLRQTCRFHFHITNFPFWVAIFNLCKTMEFLYHRSYGISRLDPLMDVLFWEWRDFHEASRIGIYRRTFEIVPQDVLWSILGSHQTLWSSPLPNFTWHSGAWFYIVAPSINQTFH